MNLRHIRPWRLLLPVLAFLLLCLCNEKHIWRWAWERGYHAWVNCHPVTDARGEQVAAWRWAEGREIRVYTTPYLNTVHVERAARAVQELTDELGLDFTVRVLPAPARVQAALAHCAVAPHRPVQYDRLCRELVATRPGHFAEILYVPGQLDGEDDVVGIGMFKYGVAVLNPQQATTLTARHEAAHLLGYRLHDTWPLVVVGYPNPLFARYARHHEADQPLMMTTDEGFTLSARSRDALVYFWRGMERRTGQRFFIDRDGPDE